MGTCEVRTENQVADNAGGKDLRCPCERADARADMERRARDLVPMSFELSGVEAGADLEAKVGYLVADRAGGTDRAARVCEGRDEPIPCRVHLRAAVVP